MDDPNNAAHVGIKGATLDPALVRIEHFTQKLPLCRPSGTFSNKVGTKYLAWAVGWPMWASCALLRRSGLIKSARIMWETKNPLFPYVTPRLL